MRPNDTISSQNVLKLTHGFTCTTDNQLALHHRQSRYLKFIDDILLHLTTIFSKVGKLEGYDKEIFNPQETFDRRSSSDKARRQLL